jgi:crotonobetainyl-CoA:carnitine CoA-transferase CaiB-like acyl-CoA transferase
VVLEGFRPGVVKRLGVDFETLAARNARLIYCSLSGFGQDGPYAQRVGHDINYISVGGALGLMGTEGKGGKPAVPMNIVADFAGGGLMAAFAILCAVVARQTTGRGQNIDVAMSDGVLSLLSSLAATYFANGSNLEPGTFVLNGAAPYYDTYETQDGRWFSVGAIEPWFYENLCRAMGREDFIADQATKDAARRAEIAEVFRKQFKTKSAEEWSTILNAVDVCAAPVLTLAEAMRDPHNRARQMVVEVEAEDGTMLEQVGIAPKLSETPGQVRHRAPLPGEHTDAVLESLGYEAAAVVGYRERGVVA